MSNKFSLSVTLNAVKGLKKIPHCVRNDKFSDDLISRQAAIDFIKDHSYPVRYDGNSIEQGMTVTGIEQALNEMPSIHQIKEFYYAKKNDLRTNVFNP